MSDRYPARRPVNNQVKANPCQRLVVQVIFVKRKEVNLKKKKIAQKSHDGGLAGEGA